ncbi:MAG: histidine--tRNA ligase [Candidatus Omnitrophica bacterium]|nr:histidine--tRNA ligase [Candidatus Omnitrophota bacterium]
MIKAIKGMEDILPQDIAIWRWLEDTARRDLESYGYAEIRTPILEETSVFVRSIGETTDIVTKEMYTFKDRGDRSLTLRPEGTAPIVRAYIENSLGKISPELKVYYIGPMFRSERPQKGRSRQFHQIGVEVFGSASVYADAEVIMQMNNMLKLFGLKGYTIKLNTLGCKKDKDNFALALTNYLKDKASLLCNDCKTRLEKNVLRVLDCKNENCIKIVANAPSILENLCPPCREGFDKLKGTLKEMGIGFEETKNLVRGLDYYTGTVFEVTHPDLGGQDAIGAGGRYDNLVKEMGGASVPAVGYALGMERVIIALKKDMSLCANVIYVATLGDGPKIQGVQIAEKIRRDRDLAGTIVITDVKESSLKSQMRAADRLNAKLVVIIGDDELKKGEVILRDMRSKEQLNLSIEEVIPKLREKARC